MVWKAGREVPASTSLEENVFEAVMQRARICLFELLRFGQMQEARQHVPKDENNVEIASFKVGEHGLFRLELLKGTSGGVLGLGGSSMSVRT